MASISTLQVGGWCPWPPTHLVSPSCTASWSFWGWALKHASIVAVSSSTPSRTAFAFFAAFLLTYVLNSLRWSLRSVDRTRPSHNHSSHVMSNHTHQSLPVTTLEVLPVQAVLVWVPRLHRSERGGDYVTDCYRSHTMTATSTHATLTVSHIRYEYSVSLSPPPHTPHTYTGRRLLSESLPSQKARQLILTPNYTICAWIFAGLNFHGLQICWIFADIIFANTMNKSTWLAT